MIGARVFTAPLAMTDQIRAHLRTIEVARRVVRDPGRYLLRFPFSLLPARWLLSDKAMDIVTRALCTGFSVGGTVPAKPPLLRVVLARNLQVGDLIDGKHKVLELQHSLAERRYSVRVKSTGENGASFTMTYGADHAFHVKRPA